MAFREAYNGRPGPTFLEIPRDVLDAEVDEASVRFPQHYRSHGRVLGDVTLVQQAADWLGHAQRPAVIAGSQIWHCRAVDALRQFAERAQVPVYLMARRARCRSIRRIISIVPGDMPWRRPTWC